MQANIKRNLGERFTQQYYYVARHHYHPTLMKLHGNRNTINLCFDGTTKTIGPIAGTKGWLQLDKVMTKDEASKFGIQDTSEKCTGKGGKSGFMFAPVLPYRCVKTDILEPLTSGRSKRQQSREGGLSSLEQLLHNQYTLDLPERNDPVVRPEELSEVEELQQRMELPDGFDGTNPATWSIPPAALTEIIRNEAQKYCTIVDNTVQLDSSIPQLHALRAALFLYTN